MSYRTAQSEQRAIIEIIRGYRNKLLNNKDFTKDQSSLKLFTVAVSLLLTIYFGVLSEFLPRHGGPDERAHKGAAAFIYENNRLPVYPQDMDKLHYAPYGTTRSFRPPLIYISTAAVQQVTDYLNVEFSFPFRKANALFGGITFLLLVSAIFHYTQSGWLSLIMGLGFILMPQTSFIFTYLNNEGAAFLASSLILLTTINLLKKGVSTRGLIYFGAACGILSLSKLSAWAFCFPVCLFAVYYIIYKSEYSQLLSSVIVTASFMLIGGWRIIFNIIHHGIYNPFNWKLEEEITKQHTIVDWSLIPNHSKLGHGYLDLLADANNFMTDTFFSTVGQLDWLRLELGRIQYFLYGLVFLLIAISIVFLFINRFRQKSNENTDSFWFELSILSGFVLLFYLYMYFNLYNDMQHQGKYIMPALPGLYVLMASCINHAFIKNSRFQHKPYVHVAVISLSIILLGYVHLHAMYKYVISFYHSNFYINPESEFKRISFNGLKELKTNSIEYDVVSDDKLVFRVTGDDPWILLANPEPFPGSTGAIALKFDITVPEYGEYDIYWNDGSGIREHQRVEGVVSRGSNKVYRILPTPQALQIRFDYGILGDEVTISNMAYSEIQYRRLIPQLNRLFNLDPTTYRPLINSYTRSLK